MLIYEATFYLPQHPFLDSGAERLRNVIWAPWRKSARGQAVRQKEGGRRSCSRQQHHSETAPLSRSGSVLQFFLHPPTVCRGVSTSQALLRHAQRALPHPSSLFYSTFPRVTLASENAPSITSMIRFFFFIFSPI